MTVPDTGARAFTLTPGQPAKLLTSNAGGPDEPATVISDDVAGCRVYLGADGGVSPATGVPLDPGTSQPWSTPGQLWAFADPAGSAPASLRLTAAIDEWQPSPAAIAAQVAAQLLAKGVPNVMTSTVVAANDALPNGGTKTYDVSKFASLFIVSNSSPLGYSFVDSAGNEIDGDTIYDGTTLAVVGPFIQFFATTPGAFLWMTGSNRAAPRFAMSGNSGATAISFGTISRTWAAGDLRSLYGPPTFDTAQTDIITPGRYWLEWRLTDSTAKARVLFGPGLGVPATVVIADTNELAASSTGGLGGSKYVNLPFAANLQFENHSVWTGQVRGTLIYAGSVQ